MSSSSKNDPSSSAPHLAAAEQRAAGKRDKSSQLAREHMDSAQEHLDAAADNVHDKAEASKGTMQKEKTSQPDLTISPQPDVKKFDPSRPAPVSFVPFTSPSAHAEHKRKEKEEHHLRASLAADEAKLHARTAGKETVLAAENVGTAVKEKSKEAAASVKEKIHYTGQKDEDTHESGKNKIQGLKESVQDKAEDLKEKTGSMYQSAKADISEKTDRAKEKAQDLTNKASSGLQSAADSARSTASSLSTAAAETGESVKHKAHDLSASMKETLNETSHGLKERMHQATQYVKDHIPGTQHTPTDSIKEDYAPSNFTVESSSTVTTTKHETPAETKYGVPIGGSYSSASSTVDVSIRRASLESPPSLPSHEANLGGYEGIQSTDAYAEGAHLASYVQDMSEL